MIITCSPLRISLAGGGTDLPSYYQDHSGFLIAAAIDKYVYVNLHVTFDQKLIIKYSKMEVVQEIDEVKHPIIREALKFVGIGKPHLEITSMADIPSGTGLGSSGSFTTALLIRIKAISSILKNLPSRPATSKLSVWESPSGSRTNISPHTAASPVSVSSRMGG